MKSAVLLLAVCFLTVLTVSAQPVWQTNLDGKVRFYETTDFGIVLAGSENSLYAFDGQTGERLWQRKHKGLNETSITPIPATDLILVSTDEGDKSRVEAVDLLSGERIWRSEKVKGDVLQLTVEPSRDLLAVVLVKKARGRFGEELKRSPVIHVLRLSDGEELWKKQLDSDVEMMPSRFDSESEIPFTLDNYRPPLVLDGRLYLFYEGLTIYDAATGKENLRERFKVNESGLALTEADPVFDDKFLYASGRGKVRAINRQTLEIEWEAKDLGVTAEIAVVGNVLYVRTGGQFTRLKDGEIDEKGAFGVSAIDTRNGKTKWRFKDADKGLTNFVFANGETIMLADKNELIALNAQTGRKLVGYKHDVEKAQFVLINESGQAVVGGKDEIAAFLVPAPRFEVTNRPAFQITDSASQIFSFDSQNPKSQITNPKSLWRVKHKAPSRGIFRIVAGIALRAAAIYFRYGGLATSALSLVRNANAVRSVLSLRWSGLRSRFGSFDLTTLAANSARSFVSNQITVFGISARNPSFFNRFNSLQIRRPNVLSKLAPSRADVQESIFEKIDPVRQVERLSDYFLKRQRLAELRGNFMYFYTDLPKPFDRKGLVGVNVHTGRNARFILVSEPDARFTTDEASGLLYTADSNKLQAFDVLER